MKSVSYVMGILIITVSISSAVIKVDTIGTTGVDLQNYGPVWQRIYYLPGFGIWTAWVKTGMWANFYSAATRTWSGEVGVFGSQRNAGGNLTICLNPGSPYYRSTFVSSYINREPRWPIVAVESIAGSGIFQLRALDSSLIECQRPPICFTANNWLHLICADPQTADSLLYSRSTDYGLSWSDPVPVCGPFLPAGPNYNLAGSERSNRLAVLWTNEDSAALWLNLSADAGSTWSGPQNIFPLPSSITGARPGKHSAYAIFDHNDRLNIITQVWDGIHQYPAEIWHWQENRSPAWSLVYRFAPGSVIAGAEPGDPFVLRPTLGVMPDGTFFALWLNYDSLNYEPQTQIARADLFIAQSPDNGIHWSRPFRLTGPDNFSRLAPGIASRIDDSLFIITVIDQLAGLYEQGHGSQTVNPVVVLRVPVAEIPGIQEPGSTGSFRRSSPIKRLPDQARLYDVTGRPLKGRLRSGVYFLIETGNRQKLVILP
ncbi:MAG: sialidase family protein [candidate division WOR-3 bacterium]